MHLNKCPAQAGHFCSGDQHEHYVHHNDWKKGHRINHDDWDHDEHIENWRAHHLRRPPVGYEWRYVDGNYVMARPSIIFSVVIGHSFPSAPKTAQARLNAGPSHLQPDVQVSRFSRSAGKPKGQVALRLPAPSSDL